MPAMPVPLLDVNAQNHPLESELQAAFNQVLKHGRFIMGPEMETFEKEIAAMVGVKHALSVSSGTDALLLALMALDIGPGDEVLCPAFTFFATAGAVSRLGATPVFTDICPISFNMDVNDARQKITPRTKVIIPVHLFGQSHPSCRYHVLCIWRQWTAPHLRSRATHALSPRPGSHPCPHIGRRDAPG